MSTKNSFFSDCRSDQTIERMTFLSGQSVAMKCPWNYRESLFWIRIVPGTLRQVLGKAFGSKQTADLRIRITEENGASLLRINRVTINDGGYYYCLKYNRELTFSKEIHLRVEGKVNENYIFLNSCTFKTHCRSSKRNSLFLLLLLLLIVIMIISVLSPRTKTQRRRKRFASCGSSRSPCDLAVFTRFWLQWQHISQPRQRVLLQVQLEHCLCSFHPRKQQCKCRHEGRIPHKEAVVLLVEGRQYLWCFLLRCGLVWRRSWQTSIWTKDRW